jgi:hypothetical protein
MTEDDTQLTPADTNTARESLEGQVPESCCCVDCGFNTAPSLLNRAEMEAAIEALGGNYEEGVPQTWDDRMEVYAVRAAVWKKARMEPYGGCLCIGCLEERLGRRLRPKDFQRDHPYDMLPATPRLRKRRQDR